MRSLLTLLSLCLAGLLIWLFLAPVGQSPLPTATLVEDSPAVLLPSADSALQQQAKSLERESMEARALTRTQSLSLDQAKTPNEPTEFLRIQIVNEATNQPVSGAKVWTYRRINEESTEQVQALRQTTSDPEILAPLLSIEYTSNADGFVEVPKLGRSQSVMVRKDEWFAFDARYRDEKRIIRLKRDQELSVVVLDHKGQPLAGVPVGAAAFRQDHIYVQNSFLTSTDAQGVAQIAHVQLLTGTRGAKDISLLPLVLLKDLIHTPLLACLDQDLHPTWTLPPLGKLEVKVVDREGRPYTKPFQAYPLMDSFPGMPGEEKAALFRSRATDWFFRRSVNGKAQMAWIGLDLDLAIAIPLADKQNSTFAFGRGPWQDGQLVSLTARPWATPTVFPLKVVDENGIPVAHASVTLFFRSEYRESFDDEAGTTDSHGFFQFEPSWHELDELYEDYQGFSLSCRSQSGEMLGEAWVGTKREPPGVRPLQQVELSKENFLIAGTVKSQNGEPVKGATLWLSISGDKDASGFGVTDKSGHFEWFLETNGTEVKIEIDQAGFLAQELAFPRGTLNAEVVLHRGRLLSGKVIPPEGLLATDFKLRFLSEETPASKHWGKILGDGTFLMDSLPNQRGTLQVLHRRQGTAFLAIEELRPRLIDETPDARLARIDLRGTVQWAKLQIVGSTFEPLTDARLDTPQQASVQARGRSDQDGVIELILPPERLTVRISAPGYLPQNLTVAEGDQLVRLSGNVTAIFQVHPVPELPEGCELWIIPWRLMEGTGEHLIALKGKFDATGKVTVQVPGAGTYGAYLDIRNGNQYMGRLASWEDYFDGPSFIVALQGDDLIGTIPVNQKDIDSAMQED